MSDWRTYGQWGSVVITAGAVITGSLWYDRRSMQIRAEDYAEIRAAKWERGAAFQDAESAEYNWNAGTVSVRVVKSKIVETIGGIVGYVDPANTRGDIVWLDTENALPGDGSKIVSYAPQWTVRKPGRNYIWSLGPNDNATVYRFRTLNTWAVEYNQAINPPAGQANTLVPVAVWGRGGSGGAGLASGQMSYFWDGQGAWWVNAGLGTNLFSLPSQTTFHMRTNDLSDVRTVARAMTRTAAWYPKLSGFSSNPNYYYINVLGNATASTNRRDKVNAPTYSDWWATLAAIAEAEKTFTVYTNAIPVVVGGFYGRALTTIIKPDPANSAPLDNYAAFAEIFFTRNYIRNLQSPYPSPQMLASGMVSRVRIYMLVRGTGYSGSGLNSAWPISDGFIGSYSDDPDISLMEYALDTTKPNAYVLEDLGTGYILCDLPEMTSAIAGLDQTHERSSRVYPSTFAVNVVYDSGGGGPTTKVPVFDIGPDFLATEKTHKQAMSYCIAIGMLEEPQDRRYYYWNEYLYNHRVDIIGAIVVVDWNFKHLVDAPYEPAPYTPEWLSTNAP